MKLNYVVVLKLWNSRKQEAEAISQLAGERTQADAQDLAERLNRHEGFAFGGFGQYYAPQRVEVVA